MKDRVERRGTAALAEDGGGRDEEAAAASLAVTLPLTEERKEKPPLLFDLLWLRDGDAGIILDCDSCR